MSKKTLIDVFADEPLSARLSSTRRHRGLTQKDVAELLVVSPNTVARWERGELGFHPAMREKVEAWIESR